MLLLIRTIIEPGGSARAMDLFKTQYQLEALKQQCLAQLRSLDCLLTPTAGRLFTIKEVLAEPIRRNSERGYYYTDFMNLLDLASVAVPTTFTGQDLPFDVALVGPVFLEPSLAIDCQPHPGGCSGVAISSIPFGPASPHRFYKRIRRLGLSQRHSGQIPFSAVFLGLPCFLFSIRHPMIDSTSSEKRGLPVSCPRCNASWNNSHSPVGIAPPHKVPENR